MPRGDGTGPAGQGSQTGRGAGYCSGSDTPGYANDDLPRQGLGRQGKQQGMQGQGRKQMSGQGKGRNSGRGRGRNRR